MYYRETLIFGGILVLCLFMTIHNNNLKAIESRNIESKEYKLSQQEHEFQIKFVSLYV